MATPYTKLIYNLAANEGLTLHLAGRFYRLLSATGSVDVGVDSFDTYDLPVGVGVETMNEFTKIRIEDTSGGANTVELAVAEKAVTDDRLTASGTINTSEDARATLTGSGVTVRATGGHDTIAANVSRKVLTVMADPANTDNLALRDSAGNTFGWLQPGQSWAEHTSAAVQVRNDTGANQSYMYSETS